MALKNVKRYTISLPKTTIKKLEMNIPKNKRSKYIAELIEKNLSKKEIVTLEEVEEFWHRLAKQSPDLTKKSALEMQREDRLSH